MKACAQRQLADKQGGPGLLLVRNPDFYDHVPEH